ncbi:DUF4936 family protein [Massilia sp. BSC265]|uniref:DUF4936 family protein n=1 Tax=Massilia sp. BSC265 TaxID=1549812 RepID=UPI0004E906BC|nr:DUF4936 family protein [Massilia sp. BSC265]KFI07673.1 hypothetical protein JN27_08880 [Massilia sp. BSC265]
MIDLYVYYKVRIDDAAALAPRVRAMQMQLQGSGARDGHGQPLLQRRPEARDGLQTWMEVYPGVDEGFGAVLERAVHDAGLGACIQGPRRAEAFIDLLPGT